MVTRTKLNNVNEGSRATFSGIELTANGLQVKAKDNSFMGWKVASYWYVKVFHAIGGEVTDTTGTEPNAIKRAMAGDLVTLSGMGEYSSGKYQLEATGDTEVKIAGDHVFTVLAVGGFDLVIDGTSVLKFWQEDG